MRSQVMIMHSIMSERRQLWLGDVHCKGSAERVQRALLYSELVTGLKERSRPCLRYKEVCKKCIWHASTIQLWKPLLRSTTPGGPRCMRALRGQKETSQLRVPRREKSQEKGVVGDMGRSQSHT